MYLIEWCACLIYIPVEMILLILAPQKGQPGSPGVVNHGTSVFYKGEALWAMLDPTWLISSGQ